MQSTCHETAAVGASVLISPAAAITVDLNSGAAAFRGPGLRALQRLSFAKQKSRNQTLLDETV